MRSQDPHFLVRVWISESRFGGPFGDPFGAITCMADLRPSGPHHPTREGFAASRLFRESSVAHLRADFLQFVREVFRTDMFLIFHLRTFSFSVWISYPQIS